MRRRNYFYIAPEPAVSNIPSSMPGIETIKPVEKIPLPNTFEQETEISETLREFRLPSFLASLTKRIQLDDIILIGLIFLLIQERVEDDFLLIILVYLLLT